MLLYGMAAIDVKSLRVRVDADALSGEDVRVGLILITPFSHLSLSRLEHALIMMDKQRTIFVHSFILICFSNQSCNLLQADCPP